MNNVNTHTQQPLANTQDGVSFFDVAEHNIKVVVSFTNGLEQVYLNDKLVSRIRSWRFSSVHKFELNGQPVEVRIRTLSLFKGPLQIELYVNGHYQDGDEWDLKRIKQQFNTGIKQNWPMFLLMIFVCGLLGGAVGFGLATVFKG